MAEGVKLWRRADSLVRGGYRTVSSLITDVREPEAVELLWILIDFRVSVGEESWAANFSPCWDNGAIAEGE